MPRLVILESPYAGNVEENVAYAREALKDSLARGEAPLASHLLYTQVLNDRNPEERQQGIQAGLEWLFKAEAMVVYTDLGLSPGMVEAIKKAEWLKIPVEKRKIKDALR